MMEDGILGNDFAMEFSYRFKKAKKDKGYTYAEISKQTGISQQGLNRYSQGQSIPTFDNAIRLSRVLGVSLDWLAYGDTEHNDSSITLYDVYKAIETIQKADTHSSVEVKRENDKETIQVLIRDEQVIKTWEGITERTHVVSSTEDLAKKFENDYHNVVIIDSDFRAFLKEQLSKEIEKAKSTKILTWESHDE